MGLPVEVALPLALMCSLAVEIVSTWSLFWLYLTVRFCWFFYERSSQYDLNHPSFFEAMRERERLTEDFSTFIDGDVIMEELWRAYSWPRALARCIARRVRQIREHYRILRDLVDCPDLYRRYLRRSRIRARSLAWPRRSLRQAQITLFQVAWTLLDRGDACYCRYRNVRYLWKHPAVRARYRRRLRYRKQLARSPWHLRSPWR